MRCWLRDLTMGTIGNARLQCQIPNDVGLAMNLSEKIGTELCCSWYTLSVSYPVTAAEGFHLLRVLPSPGTDALCYMLFLDFPCAAVAQCYSSG